MLKSIEATGKTEEEAITAGLSQLGMRREDVSVELLERAKSGFLGFGASPARVRLSYEFIESNADKARAFLEGLLTRLGSDAVPEVSSSTDADGEECLSVNLVGEKLGMLIGRRGETLDAIQHLTGFAVNRGRQKRIHVSVDAEEYRAKREESLKSLAYKVAAKVIKYRKNMTLEPMNSYERHVIHTALQDYEEISTFSSGSEPNRRVVVAYGKVRRNERKGSDKPL